MISLLPAAAQPPRPPTRRTPPEWAPLPASTRWLIVVVAALAAAAALGAAAGTALRGADVLVFAVLLGAGAASVEGTRRVPEPAGMNANDMLGAWWLATAVLLPPVYVLLAPVPLMALTQWRVRRIATHKRVYSAAAIGLAHAAGSVLFHALPPSWTDWGQLTTGPVPLALSLLAAGLLAKVLNAGLVALAVSSSEPGSRWVGVLVVDRGHLEVTETCTGVLIALCAGLSPALVLIALPPVLLLQRGMLYAQLNAAARMDAKTGLLNVVTWEREAAAALAEAGRRARPASVLLLDIDHFKHVNDTHGHLAGDEVLRGVADVLRAHVRGDKDLVGRFGGEEFVVFLPGVDPAGALRAAERLRQGVAALVTSVDGAGVQVTVSVGLAASGGGEGPVTSVLEMLARADLGLYQAKSSGRDRVRVLSRPDRRRPHRA